MLEPLAASIFSTLLSGRPFTGHHTTSQLASRMVAKASSSVFPRDFFTPRPRRVKGKERALPDDDCELYGSLPKPDSAVLLDLCIGVRPASLLHSMSSCRPRTRRMSGRKTMHAPDRDNLPSFYNLVRRADVLQRRHASSLRESLDASGSSPTAMHLDQWRQLITDYGSGAVASDPEEVWQAYEALEKSDGCASVLVTHLLDFGRRIAALAERLRYDTDAVELLRLWGTRLQSLLDTLTPRVEDFTHSLNYLRWYCLRVSGAAMACDFDSAIAGSREANAIPVELPNRVHIVEMYDTLIIAMHQHRHAVSVLEFLIEEWDAVGTYLLQKRSLAWKNDPYLRLPVRAFREHAHQIVACVEKPVAFMLDIQKRWTLKQRQLAGDFLIENLCEMDMGNEALDVLETMQQQSLPVKVELQMAVVRALVRADSFELANTLFSSLLRWMTSGHFFNQYQALGLYLFAHQGDVPRAEEYFNRLVQRGWVNIADTTMMLHAHAVNGNTERVVQLFHHFFPPPSPNNLEPPSPNIYHYTTVIYAFAKRGDFQAMNQWLETMTNADIVPDLHVYSMILKSFAERGEMNYMADLLDQMRSAGIPPSRVAYTTVIAALAKRKDPIAAEEIYKRALNEGIIPDRLMIVSLMNAYVEAGQWDGVIRAFDYIKSSVHRGLRLSVEVYNTLLKAYVLIGAPFRVVANLFQKLEEAKVRPDAHTFALLIQSACDSGLMEIASDLYAEMARLAEDWQSSLHINTYVLTIIMTGYLQKGNRGKAKAIFDEMRQRGIQPSAFTYAAIIKAYGDEPTGAGLQVAEEFLRSLMAADSSHPWMKTSGSRTIALSTVFGPLLTAYSKREKPEHVERLFEDMLSAGAEPTLGTLTALLDAYRRTGNVEAVRKMWPQILELGLRYAEVNALFGDLKEKEKADLRGHGVVMCIPLSIYVDALSSGGYHAEIAQTWRTLHEAKLAFDSHNWNHLAAALVRAGEPERAFEIVEHVILPYRRMVQENLSVKRDQEPASPLRKQRPQGEDDLPPTQSQAPLHLRDRRAIAVKTATRKSSVALEEEGKPEDFAHALHILYQFSPLWNVWRPHQAIISLLHDVLQHLESGRLVQPVRTAAEQSVDNTVLDVQAIKNRRAQAARIVARIYETCPDTVKMVREFRLVKGAHIQKARYERSLERSL